MGGVSQNLGRMQIMEQRTVGEILDGQG